MDSKPTASKAGRRHWIALALCGLLLSVGGGVAWWHSPRTTEAVGDAILARGMIGTIPIDIKFDHAGPEDSAAIALGDGRRYSLSDAHRSGVPGRLTGLTGPVSSTRGERAGWWRAEFSPDRRRLRGRWSNAPEGLDES